MADQKKDEFEGRVELAPYAKGSKSEQVAIQLVAKDGPIRLRRRGGKSVGDKVLEGLVGKIIACTGRVRGRTLLVTDWRLIEESPESAGLEQ